MRLLARFIDGILIFVVTLIIGLVFGVGSAIANDGDVGVGTSILVGLLTALIGIAYEVVMTSQRGQTLGKMAVGIRIVRLDGQALDLQSAATRYSPSIALGLIGILPIIGLLASLGSFILAIVNIVMVFSSKESVYDKVGKTQVVKAR